MTHLGTEVQATIQTNFTGIASGSLVSVLGENPGQHILEIVGPNCCKETVIINVIYDCEDFLGDGETIMTECGEPAEYCLEVSLEEILNYTVTDNGDSYAGQFAGCNFDTSYSYTYFTIPSQGAMGPYTLVSWTVGDTTYENVPFMDVQELIDLMNQYDPIGNWEEHASTFGIRGGVPGVNYSMMSILQDNTGATSFLDINSNLVPGGTILTLDIGSHLIMLTDNDTGCSDSISLFVDCVPMIPDTISNTVGINGQIELCAEDLGIIDSITSVTNICEIESGQNATFTIDPETNCIIIDGITEGIDTACLEICTDFGNCENIVIETTVTPACSADIFSVENILLQAVSCTTPQAICLEVPLADMDNYSMRINGSSYLGSIDPCIDDANNAQIMLIAGDYEIILTDTTGCTDTLDLFISCITPEIVLDTIYQNTMDTVCVDLSELPGVPVNITDDCPEQSGEFVIFDVQEDTYCVAYDGVDIGQDSACIIVCDDLGICDTTYLIVTVLPSVMMPEANNDVDTTAENTIIVINVMSNDIMESDIDTIYVLDPPTNGNVFYNGDGTFTYNPNEGYCNEDEGDSFSYVLCNEVGCDTATVTIYTTCSELDIFTGFSPNNDNINDFFQIQGVESLPGNDLCIFNRWGNQVYFARDYQNDWNGTWNGKDLPDGTYFYIFNDGEGNTYSGYLQIHR